ncbi:MAG: GIY-YIG nuclease family protein [Desulfobacteraceae bacterium]|nr:GIY-YIG nuclease family protein [Desulfobacteraceae bacterium]
MDKGRSKTQKQELPEPPKTDILLGELHILALDCQTTGAKPDKGALLEIGWGIGRASTPPDKTSIRSYLLQQMEDRPIGPKISRITGISANDLAQAVPVEVVWQELMGASRQVASLNSSDICPAVIHYARFELPFLHQLNVMLAPDSRFPFQVICTHAMAQRLLPELPRRSIRALAGYFGHAVPALKRSADHVLATLRIWQCLVELLQSRCGLNTLGALHEWLAEPFVRGRAKRAFPMQSCIRGALPDQPGIYRMRRANGEILYIGKAKSLKKRVSSYFRAGAAHAEHILEMLTQAQDLDFVATGSALEAAVLESDEIKRCGPPYNIALRPDGRNLAYGSRNLLEWRDHFDRHFCVGPLPDDRSVASLRSLAGWLAQGRTVGNNDLEHIKAAFFGFASPAGPSITVLVEGLEFFLSSHPHEARHRSALRTVAAIGAKLWRQRVINAQGCGSEPEMEAAEVEEPQNATTAQPAKWAPADVAGAIEGALMHAAHMLRRARWFRLIGNSTLAWASADAPQELKHLLVFEEGVIVDRQNSLCSDWKAPDAQRRGEPHRPKGSNMDLAAYDRLRVVTTELRRLVCEGRAVELQISPRIRLRHREIMRALRWV